MHDDITAFDMMQYDDVNAIEFASKGPAHILVRVADRWYAFDRHELHSMMKEKRHFLLGVGGVYTTPYRQTITASAWEALLYEQYSVYELIRCYDVGSVSLYAVKCLSVEEWRRGELGVVYEPCAEGDYWLLSPTVLSIPQMGGPLPLVPYCWDENWIFRDGMDSLSGSTDSADSSSVVLH
jgi:hypothetical protein